MPQKKLVEGAILGFVVGDALGVPGEFMSREELKAAPICDMVGGGAHNQLPGTWSDDTSMTLCMLDSLSERGVDFDDQMKRFADWLWEAHNTARDEVFDVGGATKSAIFNYVKGTPAAECGGRAENSCGNGSLMRILPLALHITIKCNGCLNPTFAEWIHDTSKCTHGHLRCQMACGIYCSVVFSLCRGKNLEDAVKSGVRSALEYYRDDDSFCEVYDDFENLESIGDRSESEINSDGYVIDTLEAALWCLLNTDSYRDCVLKAVNLGRDTDTTAAVAGGLAGLWYGAEQIDRNWLSAIAKIDEIKEKIIRFCENVQ